MSQKTKDAARGYWLEILPQFGIDPKFLTGKHSPCPLCGGEDRFRWDDGRGQGDPGNGGYHCSQCEAGTGFKLVMGTNHWTFGKAAAEIDRFLGNTFKPDPARVKERKDKIEAEEKKADEKRAYFTKLWKESTPIAPGDLAWMYLTRRCGDIHGLVGDIRLHPALKHMDGETFPAMLAMMGWNGKKFSGIHRTWITTDGQKAPVNLPKAVFGTKGEIRLGPSIETMGIAEGIETAICASHRFGFPVWAAGDAGMLKTWTPPEGVRNVLICGDNDRNLTGQEAAYTLGHRLALAGYQVDIRIPEMPGTDWADFQIEKVA